VAAHRDREDVVVALEQRDRGAPQPARAAAAVDQHERLAGSAAVEGGAVRLDAGARGHAHCRW
jgi:hypothetical protein